ncbi:MAG: hypothetical protein Barrevirus19_14 [Barrevirus sp.]|uniref:Uncharacterized protein n=1 Tax=Barrevirus sp. TaxID=2487763 RepID=A0A3G4ZUX1_9VIRU|nr:MAG: hypothetical protein Barrevirus19_14 [Barrevirus sp.]
MSCQCHDETMTKSLFCFNCKTEWKIPMLQEERIASCPEHKSMIAFCGGTVPSLCTTCTNDGYYVEQEGFGWFPSFTVKRK